MPYPAAHQPPAGPWPPKHPVCECSPEVDCYRCGDTHHQDAKCLLHQAFTSAHVLRPSAKNSSSVAAVASPFSLTAELSGAHAAVELGTLFVRRPLHRRVRRWNCRPERIDELRDF